MRQAVERFRVGGHDSVKDTDKLKVLFLQDVRPTAMAGDVKEVKNGYGRNYLIPNKLAVLATRDELQRADKLRKAAEDRRLKEAQDWQEIASSLAESPIEVEVRTGPTGRLYGSVTSTMIAEKIAEMIDREVNRRNIRIPAPIRTTGIYTVEAKFTGGVDANLKLSVVSDSESKEISSAIEAMEAESAEAAEAAEGEAGDAPAGEDEESAT